MQNRYTNEQLGHIAADNYQLLSKYCKLLTEDGYFTKAEEILSMDSSDTLDLYVQSLLVQFMVFGKRLNEEEILFTAGLTKKDMLGLRTAFESNDLTEAITSSLRFLSAPPILLQLFGLRDQEKNVGVTGLFFDSLLNILICLSYLNEIRNGQASKFIGLYFDKVSVFLQNNRNEFRSVDGKYIFKKLCSGTLSGSRELLESAGEDFAVYKQQYFYYRPMPAEKQGKEPEQPKKAAEEKKEPDFIPDALATAAEDAVSEWKEKKAEEELSGIFHELQEMVGLSSVKDEIHSLVNLIKVKKLREKYKLPQMNMSYHMVFTGSPGTGKTTVARLVANIYKELGILSKGTLTETDRSGLVAGYVGQTALKVREVVERSLGGVLFIDEAYALAPENASNDFGAEAIDTLVKQMEDHRDDLVVIVAGYTEEMKRFLKSNTGLFSRFNKFFSFSDYSDEELLQILDQMAETSGFCLTEDARTEVGKMLFAMSPEEKKNFGNARGIRNLFERMVSNQANRIICYPSQSKKDITVITKEDVTF